MGRTQLPSIALWMMALLPAASAAPLTTAWTHGQWFDGAAFRAVDVYSIGPRLTLRRPRHIDRTVDLAGGWVTPAFAEAHNHNIPSPDTAATIRAYLQQGIFYVMIQENVPQAREMLAGRVNVPASIDVAFANGAFTAPGGHPSALVERNIRNGGMRLEDRDGGFLQPVSSTADIDRVWWTRIRKQHPDFIKMMLVYSEDRTAGKPKPASSDRFGLDPALAAHIVKLAHHNKLRVSAHVESATDFAVAVKAGADIIAHMPGFWPDAQRIASSGTGIYEIDEQSARLAGRRHVTVVTTLGEALRTAGVPAEMRDVYHRNLDLLAKHGVRIAIGSDQFRSTSVPEALDISQAGLMTSAALLRALSSEGAAAIFPRRAPFGLAEGAPADFLVLESDPLVDFNAVQRISLRVKEGQELLLPAQSSHWIDAQGAHRGAQSR